MITHEEDKTRHPELKILIADDNPAFRATLELALSQTYSVLSVADGKDALAALRREPETFWFILTDFEMPGHNGSELLRISLEQAFRVIGAILVSADSQNLIDSEPLREHFAAAGIPFLPLDKMGDILPDIEKFIQVIVGEDPYKYFQNAQKKALKS